jgi:DNA-binding CsgD family transcriptional regulator/GAF domain-containing protein
MLSAERVMLSNHAATQTRHDLIRLCHSGLNSLDLRARAMQRLRRSLPVDSFWFATADPASLLPTGSLVEAIPEVATPMFLANEFLQDDVNKFTQLATARCQVSSLYQATRGQLEESPRYRDILVPIGFGDELRAALNTGSSCWGFMCLHRARKGSNFTAVEAELLASIAPHLAQGLRAALLRDRVDGDSNVEGPGLLLLADDLSLVASTPAGDRWLEEIADHPQRQGLPQVVYAAVARLTALESARGLQPSLAPRARVQTRSGQWLIAHASRLSGRMAVRETAVILEPAQPRDIAPLLLEAYGLTRREAEVAQLVLKGRSTREIVGALKISDLTVQQHLKLIFHKIGVGSRRELVGQILAAHYRRGRTAG